MPIPRPFIAGFAALALAACASTVPAYQQAGSDRSYGYRDTAIESNRYRISYRAKNSSVASDYALLRAAELTLSNGYDWFEIVSADTENSARRNGTGSSVRVGGSTGSYGSGVGVGIGIGLGGGQSSTESVRILEIIMGEGDKPNSPNAYDARTVQQNIRPVMNAR
ncbi:hypothetical protein [Parvularcula sp. IMCC14364]|uniref:CC0125/CC1285 family lipoprotein n=1 Tax=Parvularcula sp. IMCC14364 TaxID=3067902 RepID=UPI002740EB64|nr:hypothetical protein [Parvularcula sp. IMCC14364]